VERVLPIRMENLSFASTSLDMLHLMISLFNASEKTDGSLLFI
jgi:hypothetical protein